MHDQCTDPTARVQQILSTEGWYLVHFAGRNSPNINDMHIIFAVLFHGQDKLACPTPMVQVTRSACKCQHGIAILSSGSPIPVLVADFFYLLRDSQTA